MQILDAIRYIKKILEANVDSSCKRLFAFIKNHYGKEINSLVCLTNKYPPSARALLGALFEQLQQSEETESLFKSLNPIARYKLSVAVKSLSTTEKWSII